MVRLKMTSLIKLNGNGQPKLKYEAHDISKDKLQKVKLQILGFPQQELVTFFVGLLKSQGV